MTYSSVMANPKKTKSAAYEALVDELMQTNPDLEEGSLFGMPCIKTNGKAVLGSFDGGTVFKLFGDTHSEALALKGSALFDPSGKGRPMKDWVVVTDKHQTAWIDFAKHALDV